MVDTNILVSAPLSRFANEAGLFKAVKAGRPTLCVSDDISAEYETVLTRPKFAKADCLVTGNKRHVPERSCGSTEVVNTRQPFSRLPPVQ